MRNFLNIANHVALEAARVGFHAAFMESLEATGPDPLEALYTQVPSTTAVEEWNWLGDLPGFEEWKGDRKLGGLDAFKMRIENKDWASGLRLHQNDFKDDKLGLVQPRVAGLAQKARRHRADLMVRMLLNGFDGTAYPELGTGLAYDGAFFFSDSHAWGDNKMGSALSPTALEAAGLLLEKMTTQDGADPLDLMGTHLIVGPKLRPTAERILRSSIVAAASDTASEENIHKGRYELLVSRRLTGTYDDYWFLADLSAPIKPCIFQMREEISTSAILGGQGTNQDSVARFKAGEVWFGAEARYNVGYFAFQTIVGSAV